MLPQTEFEDEQFRPLGLGPNTLRAFAEALLSQPVATLRLDFNAGLLLYEEVLRPHEQRDFFLHGLAVEWAVRPAVSLVPEFAGRAAAFGGAAGAAAREREAAR